MKVEQKHVDLQVMAQSSRQETDNIVFVFASFSTFQLFFYYFFLNTCFKYFFFFKYFFGISLLTNSSVHQNNLQLAKAHNYLLQSLLFSVFFWCEYVLVTHDQLDSLSYMCPQWK